MSNKKTLIVRVNYGASDHDIAKMGEVMDKKFGYKYDIVIVRGDDVERTEFEILPDSVEGVHVSYQDDSKLRELIAEIADKRINDKLKLTKEDMEFVSAHRINGGWMVTADSYEEANRLRKAWRDDKLKLEPKSVSVYDYERLKAEVALAIKLAAVSLIGVLGTLIGLIAHLMR